MQTQAGRVGIGPRELARRGTGSSAGARPRLRAGLGVPDLGVARSLMPDPDPKPKPKPKPQPAPSTAKAADRNYFCDYGVNRSSKPERTAS
jgi:hypothetical protein